MSPLAFMHERDRTVPTPSSRGYEQAASADESGVNEVFASLSSRSPSKPAPSDPLIDELYDERAGHVSENWRMWG